MALAFDAASTAQTGLVADPSLTWAHTCSGANRVLVVSLSFTPSAETVSSVTYNGDALTVAGTITNGDVKICKYVIIAPDTGANNIVATFSGDVSAVGGAVSYTGAHQTNPVGTLVSATGSDDAPTVAASSAAGEIVEDVLGVHDALGPPFGTVGASQTERWNDITNTLLVLGAGSTEAGTGSVTMSWSLTAAATWAIIALPIKPTDAQPVDPCEVFPNFNRDYMATRHCIPPIRVPLRGAA